MTELKDNILFIEQEPIQMCEFCGTYAETRPYGPDGSEICFDCAMNSTDEIKRTVENTFSKLIS